MPRNGSGSYSLPEAAFVPGTTISSSAVNSDLSDIAAALTGSIAADGQTPITGALKIINGTAAIPAFTFINDTDTGFYLAGTNQLGFTAGGQQTIALDGSAVGTTGNIFLYPSGAIPCPVGAMLDWPGTAAPTGWLLCYGQAISRTTYVGLYTAIGTTFGSGDGSTTFNLPDCRGRAAVGKDNMGGSTAGRITAAVSGITGTTLGAVGGDEGVVLIQDNLPDVTLTTSIASGQGSHTHTSSTTVILPAGGGGTGAGDEGNSGTVTINAATLPAMTGTTPTGGTDTAHNNVQPTIILNKIIFAGV